MKNYSKILLLFIATSTLFFACKKEEYKAPVSNAVNMAGRWYMELYGDENDNGKIDPDDDYLIYTYHDLGEWYLVTSNSAADNVDSLVFSERYPATAALSLFPWFVKCKLPIDYTNLTFKPATVKNLVDFDPVTNIYNTVTVKEGKIIKSALTLPSGNVADSIFINLEFPEQDPGYHYLFAGHRDSGLPEDQH